MTLHDIQTICNKQGFSISLMIEKALNELEKAREEDDKLGVKMMELCLSLMLEEVDAIEE